MPTVERKGRRKATVQVVYFPQTRQVRFCGVLTQMRSAFLTKVLTRYWEGTPDYQKRHAVR